MLSNDYLPLVSVSVEQRRCLEGEQTVLYVGGPLTARTCADLREPLRDLHDRGVLRVLVDLSSVTSIDAAGLGVLVGALRRAEVAVVRREVAFQDTGGEVVRVARISGLSGFLGLPGRHPGTVAPPASPADHAPARHPVPTFRPSRIGASDDLTAVPVANHG